MRRPVVVLLGLVLAACTSTTGAGPTATDGPSLTWVSATALAPGSGEPVTLAGALSGPPLLAVVQGDGVLAMRADGLDRIEADGTHAEAATWATPALGGEVAHGREGTAVSAVTTDLGDLEEATRILWVDDQVTEVLDSPGNLPLVGVLPEGIIIRAQLGRSRLSLVGRDGEVVGLGIEASDAVLVPETTLLVLQDEDQPLRVLDVDTGDEVAVDGLPGAATFTQVVTPSTGARVALALAGPEADEPTLWVVEDDPPRARRVGDLADDDVLGGFSDDGQWVVVLRGGTRPEAVRLVDGTRQDLPFPDGATPAGWSRTTLTLQARRSGS